jgi:hypothetical protein
MQPYGQPPGGPPQGGGYGPPGGPPQGGGYGPPGGPGGFGGPPPGQGMATAPLAEAEAVRSPGMAILFTILSCGIYAMYWQYMQFKTINSWLGREEHKFGMYLLFTVLSCGIYAVYYEYKFAQSLVDLQKSRGVQVNENLPIIAVLLAFSGLSMVTWAIEQTEINKLYGKV